MRKINMHEAKTHLSRLAEEAGRGDGFIIAKAGRPIAKVVPLDAEDAPKRLRVGFLKGQIQVPEDFDRMFEDEIREMFEGSE